MKAVFVSIITLVHIATALSVPATSNDLVARAGGDDSESDSSESGSSTDDFNTANFETDGFKNYGMPHRSSDQPENDLCWAILQKKERFALSPMWRVCILCPGLRSTENGRVSIFKEGKENPARLELLETVTTSGTLAILNPMPRCGDGWPSSRKVTIGELAVNI